MSQTEITATPESATNDQIKAALLDVHTSLPGIIIEFDPAARTATVQPAIQRVFVAHDGEQKPMNLPPCVDVPVYFPSGGGFELTFPVAKGDHCLLIFSERCIDNWFSSGSVEPPDDYRQHDLSDAFAFVGFSPLGNKGSVWMGGVELKSNGDYLRMSPSKLETTCVIHAPNIITPSVNLNQHIHGGGTIQGKTGGPLP